MAYGGGVEGECSPRKLDPGGVRGVGEREKNWSYTYLVEHFEM